MTTTTRDAQALTYLATRLRDDTHGCAKWDQNGTYAIIAELVGQSLPDVVRRVIGHATDPEARTPGAIKRPFVPADKAETPGVRFPPRPHRGETECQFHSGEWSISCRSCAADDLAGDRPVKRALESVPPPPTYLDARRQLTGHDNHSEEGATDD